MDVLSDILHRSRVRGAVFARAELSLPWAVSTRGGEKAIFHAVVRGSGWVTVYPEKSTPIGPLSWRAGDLVVIPHGDAHVMAGDLDAQAKPIRGLPSETGPDGLACVRSGGGGAPTSLVCGTFAFGPEGFNLLLPYLPPVLVARGGEDRTTSWLDATLRLLCDEVGRAQPGADTVVARLSDVLFVHMLRAWLSQTEARPKGWPGALSDPALSRALAAVHDKPAAAWTAESLARQAGMSRSSFFQRFSDAVGETPGDYVTGWRMALAREALRGSELAVAEVATQVGYASEAAFSRAFKRSVGSSPAIWRAEARAA